MSECYYCGRPAPEHTEKCGAGRAVVADVKHDFYGCGTGCCGHTVRGYDEKGNEVYSHFEFDHPYAYEGPNAQERRDTFARDMVGLHFARAGRAVPCRLETCEVLDD